MKNYVKCDIVCTQSFVNLKISIILGGFFTMLRTYNGALNRTILRDLKRMCSAVAESKEKALETLREKGTVSVYVNLDPFTGCPDEFSTAITFKTKLEVADYMGKVLNGRVEAYLKQKGHPQDYLLSKVVSFIKKESRFPDKDQMRILEKHAEEKRLADLPEGTVTTPKEITIQDVAREILELAEEIMEARRETHPKDIFVHVEPYDDEMLLKCQDYEAIIRYKRYYSEGNSSDYSIKVFMMVATLINEIRLGYAVDGTIYICAKDEWDDKEIKVPTRHIVGIHKFIAEMARNEGIEFVSEIDYDKVKDE